MEKFKGTQGPWDQQAHVIWANDYGNEIGMAAMKYEHGIVTSEGINNARLIASAPDLLEALQQLVGHFSGFTPMEIQAKENAQKAINKALGIPTNPTDQLTQSRIMKATEGLNLEENGTHS